MISKLQHELYHFLNRKQPWISASFFLSHIVPGCTGLNLPQSRLRCSCFLQSTNFHGPCLDMSLRYPLVNVYIAMERSTIFNGKIHYKWSFSIAMLNYQRVSKHANGNLCRCSNQKTLDLLSGFPSHVLKICTPEGPEVG